MPWVPGFRVCIALSVLAHFPLRWPRRPRRLRRSPDGLERIVRTPFTLCRHPAAVARSVHMSPWRSMLWRMKKTNSCTRMWGVGTRTIFSLEQSSRRHMCLSFCPSLLRRCLFANLKGLYGDWRCCTSRPAASSRPSERGLWLEAGHSRLLGWRVRAT